MNFDRLIHSDWSKFASGRVTATAIRSGGGWRVDLPTATGDLARFVDRLCDPATTTLAGFDFPIGLPRQYGVATNFAGFLEALPKFGSGEWAEFYDVAAHKDEISLYRPFYPSNNGGRRQSDLLIGHQVDRLGALMRDCERSALSGRTPASSLFWTMGPKQVGKAALCGWRDVVIPCRERRGRVWPFQGSLADLALPGSTVLAETYPAEVYRWINIPSGLSKNDQASRAGCARTLRDWCAPRRIDLSAPMRSLIEDGFGTGRDGGDRFDAFVGLLGMIEVVDDRRAAAPAHVDRVWEGWILGQHA